MTGREGMDQASEQRACRMFCVRVAAAFLGTYLALLGAAHWLVDPDMRGGIPSCRWTRHRFFYSALSLKNLLPKLEDGGGYALVFGTSRSQKVSSRTLRAPVLNLWALYGNPRSAASLLGRLSPRQIAGIKRIYFLIDPVAFKDRFYVSIDYKSGAALWRESLGTIGNPEVFNAARTISRNITGDFTYYMDPGEGSPVLLTEPAWDPGTYTGEADDVSFSPAALEGLGEVDRFAKRHGIPIVYFTLPISRAYFQATRLEPMLALRKALLAHIDGFYDLTYIDGVSDQSSSFSDASHLREAVLARLFHEVLIPGAKRRFVTAAGIDRQLLTLRDRHRARP